MGLDVYLYRYEDLADSRRRSDEYERRTEALYESEMPDDERAAKRKAIADELGLAEWGDDPRRECIGIPWEGDPEHYFKVGYFRSSYNDSGCERIYRNLGISTLHDIFKPGDDYIVQPNWHEALILARMALVDYREATKGGLLRSTFIDGAGSHRPEVTQAEAVAHAKGEMSKRQGDSFRAYSSINGVFYLDGMEFVAFMPGRSALGRPGVVAVYKSDDREWYDKALQIVIATIEYVLAKDDPSKYVLHWSG